MTSARRPSHTEDIISSLRDKRDIERFTAARVLLQRHLVLKRDILHGKDFLFSGSSAEIHGALKNLVGIEHQSSRFLQFDYTRIDDYFLLRIVGESKFQQTIDSYFD